MVNDFFRNIPRYNDDSDFTTNADSYYKDLARKQKLIKLLAEKIWKYDEELAKRFEAWDKNLEDFPEDVKKLLEKWINDGTIDQIINETLFNKKPDRTEMMALFDRTSFIQTSNNEPSDERVDYWYKVIQKGGI